MDLHVCQNLIISSIMHYSTDSDTFQIFSKSTCYLFTLNECFYKVLPWVFKRASTQEVYYVHILEAKTYVDNSMFL